MEQILTDELAETENSFEGVRKKLINFMKTEGYEEQIFLNKLVEILRSLTKQSYSCREYNDRSHQG